MNSITPLLFHNQIVFVTLEYCLQVYLFISTKHIMSLDMNSKYILMVTVRSMLYIVNLKIHDIMRLWWMVKKNRKVEKILLFKRHSDYSF